MLPWSRTPSEFCFEGEKEPLVRQLTQEKPRTPCNIRGSGMFSNMDGDTQ